MVKKSESGQAIVFLVFAVIGLVAFTALAIDGGMVYADRRHAQSASDAASLSGGGYIALYLDNSFIDYYNFNCATQTMNDIIEYGVYKAQERAEGNDYIDEQITVNTNCEDNGHMFDKTYVDISTEIIKETETSMIQVVYGGSTANVVTSTVRIRPRRPLAIGNAIVALNPDNCQGQQNGAKFHGNALVEINGGGIWTNGCLRGVGTPDVDASNGSINYVEEVIGSGLFNPPPQQAPDVLPPETYWVDPPDCTDPAAHNVNANAIDGVLAPGLYCVSGDIKINAHDTVIGHGVTLYLLNGGTTINGGATVELTAPLEHPDPSPAIPGIIIMTAPGNSSDIQLTGTRTLFSLERSLLLNRTLIAWVPEIQKPIIPSSSDGMLKLEAPTTPLSSSTIICFM